MAAVFLLVGAAGQVYAKPVVQEDFKGPAPKMVGKHGRIVGSSYQGPGGEVESGGTWLEYDLAGKGFNPQEGTVEMDLTRGENDPYEVLASFVDAQGVSVAHVAVYWEGLDTYNERATAFTFESRAPEGNHILTRTKDDMGLPIMVPGAYLKNHLAKGRTVHVAATWGSAGVKIYIDGDALPSVTNALPKLQAMLAKAEKLVVGGQLDFVRQPGGAYGMSASLLANVQLNDQQLQPKDFGRAIVGAVPVLSAVEHNAFQVAGFSGKLVAGNNLQVTVKGTPGVTGSFDIAHLADLDGKIALSWKGYGVYLEDKTFYEEGEVNLKEVKGYAVYAGKEPIDIAAPGEPVKRLEVQEQSYTLEFLDKDVPYYVAVLAEMEDGSVRTVMANPTRVPLTETEPGVYAGSYAVGNQDRYPHAVVVGRLAKDAAAGTLVDPKQLTIDASLNIAVVASPQELRADEKSTSAVEVTVTDANGSAVAGRKVRFVLATTSQYTGVVGGGAFTEQVGGSMTESTWAVTDLFGRIKATYVAGFAAKTAVIVARDMASNSTGAGYVKTYIQSTAELQLEPVEQPAVAGEGYEITVTTSDDWLTADGKSQARITARVTLNGKAVEGHNVDFDVSSGAGTIRTVKGTTDRSGEARATYTAGKKIGVALITATDTTIGISASVQIELRSDAPAKIKIQIKPEKLPADGHSTADVLVQVMDINDNPNENTEVEFAISTGGGRLRDERGLTDRNGEFTGEYIAGRSAGKVAIEITVRSTEPTAEEFAKAQDLALSGTDLKFF
jgi:hypothetical protein